MDFQSLAESGQRLNGVFFETPVEGLQEALLYSVYAVYLMGYRDTLASTVCPLLLLNRFRTAFSSI